MDIEIEVFTENTLMLAELWPSKVSMRRAVMIIRDMEKVHLWPKGIILKGNMRWKLATKFQEIAGSDAGPAFD